MRSRSNSRAVTDSSSGSIDEIVLLERERCKLLYRSGLLDDDEINSRGELLRREIDQLKLTQLNTTSTSMNVAVGSTDGMCVFPTDNGRLLLPHRVRQISPKTISSDSDDADLKKKLKNRFFFCEELKELDENENEDENDGREENDPVQMDMQRGYHSCNQTPTRIQERNSRNRRHTMTTTFADENFSNDYDDSLLSTFPNSDCRSSRVDGFMEALEEMKDQRNRDLSIKKQRHSSMAISKSGNNNSAGKNVNGNNTFRPISLSLSRRTNSASRKFDQGTLQLLESLNLINTGTNTDSGENVSKSLFSPGYTILDRSGGTNFDDNISDVERYTERRNVEREDDNEYVDNFCGRDHDEDDVYNADEMINDSHRSVCNREKDKEKEKERERERVREKETNVMNIDCIYQDTTPQLLDVIHENSPYYYSANNTPEKANRKGSETKGRRTPSFTPSVSLSTLPVVDVSSAINVNSSCEMKVMTGLMDGGVLEFCTVDMNLLALLSSKGAVDFSCYSDGGNMSSNSSYRSMDERNTNTSGSRTSGTDASSEESVMDISSYASPEKSCCIPSQSFSIEHIHDFCFPSGVPIDFVSVKEAKNLTDSSGTFFDDIFH